MKVFTRIAFWASVLKPSIFVSHLSILLISPALRAMMSVVIAMLPTMIKTLSSKLTRLFDSLNLLCYVSKQAKSSDLTFTENKLEGIYILLNNIKVLSVFDILMINLVN